MAPLLQLSFEQLIRRPECTCLQTQNIERSVWRHSREHHQSPSGSCSIPTQSMWNHAPRWQSALEHLIMVTSDRSVANTAKCKGKEGMYTWYSASSRNTTSDALKYGTCSQGISQFYLHIHTFIHNRNEPYLPFKNFPAISGTHLPTLEGWNAELAWVAGYVVRQFTCLNAVIPLLIRLNVDQLRWSRPSR